VNTRRFRADVLFLVVGEVLLILFLVSLVFFSPLNAVDWVNGAVGLACIALGIWLWRRRIGRIRLDHDREAGDRVGHDSSE
jgi:cadmium resistance protein CadD (predicted permease)